MEIVTIKHDPNLCWGCSIKMLKVACTIAIFKPLHYIFPVDCLFGFNSIVMNIPGFMRFTCEVNLHIPASRIITLMLSDRESSLKLYTVL